MVTALTRRAAHTPPHEGRGSHNATRRPRLASSAAVATPANPPPTITASYRDEGGIKGYRRADSSNALKK
jgi:hypothetical protein